MRKVFLLLSSLLLVMGGFSQTSQPKFTYSPGFFSKGKYFMRGQSRPLTDAEFTKLTQQKGAYVYSEYKSAKTKKVVGLAAMGGGLVSSVIGLAIASSGGFTEEWVAPIIIGGVLTSTGYILNFSSAKSFAEVTLLMNDESVAKNGKGTPVRLGVGLSTTSLGMGVGLSF